MTRKKAAPPKKTAPPTAKQDSEPATGKTPSKSVNPSGEKPVAKALARKRHPQIAREMLTVELRRIRSLFVEIGERYLADTEGRIVAVIEELDRRKLPMANVERLLKEIRGLSVKPRKGRRKDLARIETIVDTFRKTLEE